MAGIIAKKFSLLSTLNELAEMALYSVTRISRLVDMYHDLHATLKAGQEGGQEEEQQLGVGAGVVAVVGGCSHMTSAKIGGWQTPPPPLISKSQKSAYPLPP